MKIFLVVFCILLVFSECYESLDKGRFVFSAPKRFLAGSDEKVCISFKDKHGPADLQIIALEDKTDGEIASAFQKIAQDEETKCFNISMPRTKARKGRLQLIIHFKTEEDYKVNYIRHIFIQSNPDVTFIQTDKPVYNGGQIVKFRIFTVRPDLSPVLEPMDEVHIENPNGIYLAQWFNVSSEDGFISKHFLLTSDPLPGKWMIKVKKDEEIAQKIFLVEDYVLPRFYLTLNAPESVDFPFNVNVTACARYNFGKPVKGTVILHFKVKCPFTYYCRDRGNSLKRRFQLDLDGCVTHEIQLSNITSLTQKLVINATVEEEGTGAKVSSLVDAKINPYSNFTEPQFSIFVRKRQFKAGLPIIGKILTKGLKDNTSFSMSLCLIMNEAQSCREVIISSPETEFIIFPDIIKNSENFISYIELKYPDKSSIVARLGLIPWYSPSDCYLLLENEVKEPFHCNTSQKLKAMYSIPDDSLAMRFHYMIKSRGDIISEGSFVPKREDINQANYTSTDGHTIHPVNYFYFEIKIEAKMSPISHLLLYHIRPDGEIVADILTINIKKCFKNQVELSWENEIGEPGSKNLLKLRSSPNSVCALNVFDESLKLVSKFPNIDEDAVFKAIEKFEIQPQFSEICTDRYRNRMNRQDPLDASEPLYDATSGMSRFVDSLQAFDDFGVTVITDLTLETRPCMDSENVTGESMNNLTSRHSVIDISGEPKIEAEFDENTFDFPNSPAVQDLLKKPFAQEVRSFFPESWIWNVVRLNDQDETELKVTTPHALTTWNAHAICLSNTNGLGISKISRLRSFKPFFLDFATPRTVKRKEILHLQVSLFNYLDEDLPMKITFFPSENFISKSEEIIKVCIAPNSKIVHIYPLEAIKLGETEIKIKAEIEFSPVEHCDNFFIKNQSLLTTNKSTSDIVLKKTIVTHEGFPVEQTKSGFICGESNHFESNISWNIKIPADVVESSIFISASVSGDILGPALQNANNLITLPTGCGEQNMILLVPNLLLLEYFLLTKAKETGLIEKALKNLDLGYQRQLKYKRPDGSYSAFGENDGKGSIWLTAFVVRYLSQAQKYIHIDKSDLKLSVKWINKQQLENGCFPVIGKFYHQDMKKEILEEDSSKTLTAYILISLIESGMTPKTSTVIKNAIYCLKRRDESLGLYRDLMISYALLLAGETRDAQTMIIDLLKDAKRSYRMLWWENDENSSIESNIEMTSYGILSLVKLGGSYFLAAASDAVRWITQYRNQNGGFLSTQDTIVALEAIAKFSAILPKTNDQDQLSVELKTADNLNVFNLTNENRLLQQSLALPSLVSNVTFIANGKGCALVQTVLRYNARKGAQSEKFKINLKIDSVSEVDQQTIKRFHVCIRYKGAKDKINMAVMEVFMVSGFYPDRSSLYDINISHKGVRMWEEFEDRIHFYFEDLKNRKNCVEFLVRQETCVENASPALIKLYDYYNTQYQSTIRYNLQSNCNQSLSWVDNSAELKSESKRELRLEDYTLQPDKFQEKSEDLNHFQDLDFDLETPQGGDGVMPVFALPPPPGSKDQNCPLCLTTVPDLFSKMYCSSQAAVRVFIRGKDIFDFRLDLTPRRNITVLRRTVSFTMKKECECPVLNSVNSYALLLVTPPRTVQVNVLQEMHLDSLTQLYSLEKGDELPQFVVDAMNYCKNWKFNE